MVALELYSIELYSIELYSIEFYIVNKKKKLFAFMIELSVYQYGIDFFFF